MLVKTAVGIVALATATYTIVARITKFETTLESNTIRHEKTEQRISNLENKELPAGIAFGKVQGTIIQIERDLDKLENRIEFINGRLINGEVP